MLIFQKKNLGRNIEQHLTTLFELGLTKRDEFPLVPFTWIITLRSYHMVFATYFVCEYYLIPFYAKQQDKIKMHNDQVFLSLRLRFWKFTDFKI